MHAFFVTTSTKTVSVKDSGTYGFIAFPLTLTESVIPLVIHEATLENPVNPKFRADGRHFGSNQVVVDSNAMRRFLSEDAYIRHGINTTGAVMYGDKQIGPSGSIRDGRSMP